MSCYPQPYGHIQDNVKVLSNLSNYATEQELRDAAGFDNTSNLAAQKDTLHWKLNLTN